MSAPHQFEFHAYLRKVLKHHDQQRPFFIANELDFQKGEKLNYPYRSYFFAFGLLHSGKCRIRVGIQDFEMKRRSLTIVGPGITRLWLDNYRSARNTTFFLTPELFPKPFYNNFLVDYEFFKSGARHVIELDNAQYQQACEMIDVIKKYEKNLPIVRGLMYSLLEFIKQMYSEISHTPQATGRGPQIVRDFNQLLSNHFQQQKQVSFYADQLNISPKYLSHVVKNQTGKAVKRAIEEFVIFEARSLLQQTDMSIKEIVFWLGFEDPSYFTKLFKAITGITPQDYRRNL